MNYVHFIPFDDIKERALNLRYQEGKKFFDPVKKEIFPEGDFWLCVDVDRFDFAIEVKKEDSYYIANKVNV